MIQVLQSMTIVYVKYEMPCDYTLITQNYDTTGDVRFILPNAVTSNADGQNDNWRPIFGQGIDSAHYSIYDGISHLYDEKKNKIVSVKQNLITTSSIYPIIYKLREYKNGT